MQTIAKFLKISKEQFINDFKNTLDNYDESQIENIYESIKLPKRATIGSAGYDFYNENYITNEELNDHGTHVAGTIGALGNNISL